MAITDGGRRPVLADGVLVIDKPAGLTSHDVVAVARRVGGLRRIGHTGTLDPMATGVLALACGRATRLVRFLGGGTKRYLAGVTFGLVTDTYDVTGREVSRTPAVPLRASVEQALGTFLGEQWQVPPAYSAKRVDGQRAYDLARRQQPVEVPPARVTLHGATLLSYEGGRAELDLTCSAGFYVRSLAHDLGARTGSGGCLHALRRTGTGAFDLSQAVTLEMLIQTPELAAARQVPLDALLPDLPDVRLGAEDAARVAHGGPVAASPASLPPVVDDGGEGWVRLRDAAGRLLAVGRAEPGRGVLHPVVVLV